MAAIPDTGENYQALGESDAFVDLQERISRAAKTNRPIIFIGERGTGKEIAAGRLHLLSGRWNNPYVTVNCASLSESLIESELFGHEAGSFTGATRLRKGRFEMADGGSLFLDEVANIPMATQEKILRVVEYGHFERVGSSNSIRTDVRLIAATNEDLRRKTAAGEFRADLLDRLSFEVITLPPLRAREGDIMLLAVHFARRMSGELDREGSPVFTEGAAKALMAHPWNGNVRELKNVVERMVYRAEEGVVDEIVFDPFDSEYALPALDREAGASDNADDSTRAGAPELGASNGAEEVAELMSLPLEEAVEKLEVDRLRKALEATQFNQRKAADRLGLTYHQFRGYYRKYREKLSGETVESD